ncbi:MAG: DUF169 domain-containing protein [Candidatus Hodarchaeota archaeon]
MSKLEFFQELGKKLNEDLHLQTFPLAIRFLKSKNDIPEKAHRPSALNMQITMCQGYTFSRRIGWTMGLAEEDMKCTPNLVAYGFTELTNNRAFIEAFRAMDYYATDDAAQQMLDNFSRITPGDYEAVVISPLAWTKVEPDVILIHGNSTQVMRLIQASIYNTGEPLLTRQMGMAASCIGGVLHTFQTSKPNMIIPGAGDRIFGAVQDHEIIFTLSGDQLEETVLALRKAGYKMGIRYPMPVSLTEPTLIPIAWEILDKHTRKLNKSRTQ